MLKKLLTYLGLVRRQPGAPVAPCLTQGEVHLLERNGGRIEVHPTALLNSRQDGYHVGMPFQTTLIADAPGSVIKVGASCRIHGAYLHAWDSIVIGKNVLIAAGTNIVDANGHSLAPRYARFRANFKDTPRGIVIGDHVWIGMNAIILKGVEIGECAVISAGAVVRESVPPFAVVEGNPAKVVRILDASQALAEDYPLDRLENEAGFYRY